MIGAIVGAVCGVLLLALIIYRIYIVQSRIPDFEGACKQHCGKFATSQGFGLDGQDDEESQTKSRVGRAQCDYRAACGLVLTPIEAFVPLESLPDEARAVKHYSGGMPDELRSVPMRLLSIRSLLTWSYLKVYEEVTADHALDPSNYLEIPYSEVTDEHWRSTVILSWRWAGGKPREKPDPNDKVSPMDELQFAQLKTSLQLLVDKGVGTEFIWVRTALLTPQRIRY